MGILNITPDSFSDGGNYLEINSAVERAAVILEQGADVLDIGAQSTRPGAEDIGYKAELSRLIPSLKKIRQLHPEAIISIDTFNSKVAEKSLEIGANWINDVSGGRKDPDMFKIVAEADIPYVLTHSRGDSKSMNSLSTYDNLIDDIHQELLKQTEIAMSFGIRQENIIWDPGLGFAKNTQQNLQILKDIEELSMGLFPLLIGPSRKKFIGDILGIAIPEQRIWGTAAIACRCSKANVNIIRVHDVFEIVNILLMSEHLW